MAVVKLWPGVGGGGKSMAGGSGTWQCIERISEVKYLGLMLNEFLNWNIHHTFLKKNKPRYWITFKNLTFHFLGPNKINIQSLLS